MIGLHVTPSGDDFAARNATRPVATPKKALGLTVAVLKPMVALYGKSVPFDQITKRTRGPKQTITHGVTAKINDRNPGEPDYSFQPNAAITQAGIKPFGVTKFGA